MCKKITAEKQSADILTLYKQMKLQKELKNCKDLERGKRESMIYTNKRLINEIADLIEITETDYPKSY
jgi:prophage antirepressor-like protein